MTQEIQELLEGTLNDEQTAEVLHRLSVSPEKLSAFRQHMALQGAFDRDGKVNDLKEEEDDAAWAAILGATGGVVTGVAGAGASGWLAKGAAFLATAVAGFVIGVGIDGAISEENEPEATSSEQTASVAPRATTPVTGSVARVDTVYKTIVEPKVVYQDRIVYKDRIVYQPNPSIQTESTQNRQNAEIGATQSSSFENSTLANSKESISDVGTASTSSPVKEVPTQNTSTQNAPAYQGPSEQGLNTLSALASRTNQPSSSNSMAALDENEATNNNAITSDTESSIANLDGKELNELLHNNASDEKVEERSRKAQLPELDEPATESVASIVVKEGFEIAYSERIGRIAPAPAGLKDVDPNFEGRSIDLSYRILDGYLGFGGRLMYGSFARVTLEAEPWFALGVEEVKFVPNLKAVKGFGTEFFLNTRVPLFSEKTAIGAEMAFGSTESYNKIGGDLSLLYMITDKIGARIGAGYSSYWYSTQEEREVALDQFENTGLTSGIEDRYRGTMLEGRYGLIFKF